MLAFTHQCAKQHWGDITKSYQESCLLLWRNKDRPPGSKKIRNDSQSKIRKDDSHTKIRTESHSKINPTSSGTRTLVRTSKSKQVLSCAHDALAAAIQTLSFSACISGEFDSDESVMEVVMGLHAGWAVQSAIGSDVKLNISYLSVHQDMAHTLTALAKHVYKVRLIISGEFRAQLSHQRQSSCRHLDRVVLDAACGWDCAHEKPIDLYTIDFDAPTITTKRSTRSKSMRSKTKRIGQHCLKLEPFSMVRTPTEINTAIDLYVSGKWDRSYPLLRKHSDEYGASVNVILEFMDRHRVHQPPIDADMEQKSEPAVATSHTTFAVPPEWEKGRRLLHPRNCLDSWTYAGTDPS